MPSESEINKMRDQLFGGIDEDDGLDKAFEAIQSMRGECALAYLFVVLVFLTIYYLEHGKNMSDEERRKMAAQVALSFAAQLGL